ncbi:MAG: hypothetical protein B6230_03125 [Desulfobacteraceae bacterium 4572_89]|nr:MAG: hypothetical protein B6230_03125 [Desulfobacteraceae bacterium 4572_89]
MKIKIITILSVVIVSAGAVFIASYFYRVHQSTIARQEFVKNKENSQRKLAKEIKEERQKTMPPPLSSKMSSLKNTKQSPPGRVLSNPQKTPCPESLLKKLGIAGEDIIKNRGKYRNHDVHIEWMDHVYSVFNNLDPLTEEAIIHNHTTLLYIKDNLDKAYLNGEISQEEFNNGLTELMKWFQATNESILNEEEYKQLFGISVEDGEKYVDQIGADIPEYGFILNSDIAVEEVKNLVQGYKLEEINTSFKKMVLEREKIGNKVNADEITLEEARQAFKDSQQSFVNKCKDLLTEQEVEIIFGSMANLEMGVQEEKQPDWAKHAEEELGFPVENSKTTLEMVQKKLDKQTMDDLSFFHQNRKKEIEGIGIRLDKGEITLENAKNIANDLQAVYRDNCRSILSDEEFTLIFGSRDNQTSAPSKTDPGQSDGGKI